MRRSSKRLLAVILSLIMVMTVVMPAMAADGEATIATCEHTMTKFEGVDPTCGKSGYNPYYYCSSCELYYLTEDGEYAGFESEEEAKSEATRAPFGDHTLVEVPAVEPTCTEDGLEFHWRCSVCEAGRMYNPEIPQPIHNKTTFEKFILPTLVIPANGEHTMTKFEGVEPTCGKSGHDPYYYCSSCELYYLTEDGEYAGFESEEEAKSEGARPPVGDHTLVEVPAVEPTCTEDGLEFHWRCSVCEAGRMYDPEIPQPIHNKTTFEKFILPTLVIPAAGEHTMTKIDGVDPTCGKSGYNPYYYCSSCELYYLTEDGEYAGFETEAEAKSEGARPATADHTLKEVPAVAPTCTEDGCKAYWQCSVCGKCSTAASGQPVHSEQIFNQHLLPTLVIPAAGEHTMTKFEGVEPTCGKSGHDPYYYCSVCELYYLTEGGEYAGFETEAEAKSEGARPATADHTLKEVPAVASTCTEDGCKAYWQCSVCGKCSTAASGQPVHAEQLFKDRLLPTLVIPAAGEHTMTKVEAVAPTYTTEGNIEHFACSKCDGLFADAEGKTETTKEDVILPRLIEIKEDTADITSGAVDTAIEEAETEEIVIDLVEVAEDDTPATETTPVVEAATLPVESLEKVAEISEEATLTVNMTEVSVTMDSKTMAAVAEQSEGETLTLKVEKVETETLTETQQAAVEDKEVAVVITATMMSNNKAISDFKGGVVTIAVPFTVPAGAKAEDFKVYYLDDNGNLTAHDTKYENGCLIFTTTHFSDYVVVNTAAASDAPNTGVKENVAVYAVALTFSMICAIAVVIGKKKFSF